jgi:hypothetical protein
VGGRVSASRKPFLRDRRDWNALLALAALLLAASAVALAIDGSAYWPVRLAVTGVGVALLANAIGRGPRA